MRYFIAIIICFVAIINLKAQEFSKPPVSETVVLLDSTLVGVSIFNLVESTDTSLGKVKINQPNYMGDAFSRFILSNEETQQHGYRIRLFFSNKQNARVESEKLEDEFNNMFPLIPTYRSYTTPYFKIVVGDYRTKSDAMHAYGTIKQEYPNAIIVKDYIEFPALN